MGAARSWTCAALNTSADVSCGGLRAVASPGRLACAWGATSCALVGSSGSLRGRSLGSTIDRATAVIRMNLAPVRCGAPGCPSLASLVRGGLSTTGGAADYARDVGRRTDWRALNSAVQQAVVRAIGTGNASRVLGALTAALGDPAPGPDLLLLGSAKAFIRQARHRETPRLWRWPSDGAHLARGPALRLTPLCRLPSAGLSTLVHALAHCGKVTAYGFEGGLASVLGSGPSRNVTRAPPTTAFHYYDHGPGTPAPGVHTGHDWGFERRVLALLARAGCIRVV